MAPSKKKIVSSSLLTALDFCDPVMKSEGTVSQTHVTLNNKWCIAFDGIIAIGHPIDEELSSCPQYTPLRSALKKSKDAVSITQNDNGNLSIVSGKLKANVKSAQYHQLMVTMPDICQWPLQDTIRTACKTLEKVLKDDESNLIVSSLLLRHSVAVATDGIIYLEYWHGNPLPELTLAKRLVSLLAKLASPIVGFGYTPETSITFYMENGAWIKSQLRSQTWPNMSAISDIQCDALNQVDISVATAIDSVLPHSPDGVLHFGSGFMRSHPIDQGEVGASYSVPELPTGLIFNGAHMVTLARLAKAIQWQVPIRGHYMAGFTGDNLRGFLMSRER